MGNRQTRRKFLKHSAAATTAVLLSRQRLLADQLPARKLARDPMRPQYHLMPQGQWMNDPNGPVFWNGKYHLFYQLNPHDSVWGDMHWGHAISDDMVHWKHLPIAIAPEKDGPDAAGVFSGSIVNDNGTATALYTGVSPAPMSEATLKDPNHPYKEQQCLRTAKDAGLEEWSEPKVVIAKPPESLPIATIGGFRDPAPWREGDTWYMLIGSGEMHKGGMALLYRSSDLYSWQYMHPFAEGPGNGKDTPDTVDSGTMWECPDFFSVGGRGVLLYSTERKVFWRAGKQKSWRLSTDKKGLQDYGAFYAPKSFLAPADWSAQSAPPTNLVAGADGATSRRILWGWINETRPEAESKRSGWAGAMSLPREVTIGADGAPRFWPAKETDTLLKPGSAKEISGLCGRLDWDLGQEPKTSAVELVDAKGVAWLTLAYDTEKGELKANDKSMPMAAVAHAKVQAWVDASVVEIFANGENCCVLRIYKLPQGKLKVHGDAKGVTLRSVAPISANRLTT